MKKLTLALIALMAVSATAEQHRHYVTKNGVVHATSAGKYETSVVRVAPAHVVVPTSTSRVYLAPVTTRTVILQDTADVDLVQPLEIDAYDPGHYDSDLDRARYNRTYIELED